MSRRFTMHLASGGPKQHALDNHNLTITRYDLVNNTKILCHESDHNKLSIIEALLIRKMHPSINNQSTGINRTLKIFHIACPFSPTRFSTFCTFYFITFPLTSLTVPCKTKLYWHQYCCSYYYILFFHWHWSFLLFPCLHHFSLTLIISAVPMCISFFFFHWNWLYLKIIFFCTITLPGFTPQTLIINSLAFHEVTPILISWRWLM